MRDIKFRAWDKVRKEFLSAGNVFIAVNPGARPVNNPIYLDLLDRPDAYKDRFILEQYTGLHDQNGREIYEGDVFVMTDPKLRHTVEWHDTGLMGKQVGTVGSYVGLKSWLDRIMVIGNIHEN